MKNLTFYFLVLVSPITYGTEILDCDAQPYRISIVYSLSSGAQEFSLYKNDVNLISGSVSRLNNINLVWMDSELDDNLSFKGSLGEEDFHGTSNKSGGSFTIQGQRYVLICDWGQKT